jgi:addiction module RelB/DinJ family antitoxin
MKTSVLSVKVDEPTKQKARAVASQLGIPLSTLVNAYLRDLAATGVVHFEVAEQMTPQMERVIAQAEREIKNGELSPAFSDVDDAFAWLKAQKAESDED